MLRNRFLILLGGSLLAASAAWADDIGYIDCSNHSDATQVFAKARRSPEVVASLPCGERFTILVYGFVFSRVQTKDGNVGYVFSNLISVDRGTASVQKTASTQLSDAKMKVPSSPAPAARPVPSAPVKPQTEPVQSVQASTPALPSAEVVSAAVASPAVSANAPQPAAATLPTQPAPVEPPASSPASNLAQPAAPVAQPAPTPAVQPPPPVQPVAEPAPVPTSPAATSSAVSPNAPESSPVAAQPAPSASVQPQPAPAAAAEPASPAIRPHTRETWEKPNPGGRRGVPLLELFGGYAYTHTDNGAGTTTNMNGAMGSFGWNFKSWLQILADSSYSVVTVSGAKNVLYGNHFGARYFHRGHNRWALTPFGEALVGGSRADTSATVGGTSYKTSQNCLSYKLGGGVDIHPSRRFDIRVIDADYYRTAFGTNAHQNNYWISTGIVFRLFGGHDSY